MTPNDTSGSQRSSDTLPQLLKQEILGRIRWYLFLSLLVLGFAAILTAALIRVQTGELTLVEQILIQFFLTFIGVVFAWLVAKRDEEGNILSKQKALAKSAVRRILGISRSAARHRNLLRTAVSEVSDESGLYRMSKAPKALFLEKLSLFEQQLAELRDNIDDSIGDWRDILPEEFEKVQEFNRTVSEAQEEMSEQLEKVRVEIEQKGEEESKKREELDNRIVENLKKFDERLGRKWSELQPFGTFTNVVGPATGRSPATGVGGTVRFYGWGATDQASYYKVLASKFGNLVVRQTGSEETAKEHKASKSREEEKEKKKEKKEK